MKPTLERLSAHIHALRERRITTQAEIAAKIGITEGQLSSQLSGRNRPSIDRVEAIAAAAGCYLEMLSPKSAERIHALQAQVYVHTPHTPAEIVELALYSLQCETNGFPAHQKERYLSAKKKRFALALALDSSDEIRYQLADENRQLSPKKRAKLQAELANLEAQITALNAEIAELMQGIAP